MSSSDDDVEIVSDDYLDQEQSWMDIHKRALLSARANMRGENSLPRSEDTTSNLSNVLLHHDYAESSRQIASNTPTTTVDEIREPRSPYLAFQRTVNSLPDLGLWEEIRSPALPSTSADAEAPGPSSSTDSVPNNQFKKARKSCCGKRSLMNYQMLFNHKIKHQRAHLNSVIKIEDSDNNETNNQNPGNSASLVSNIPQGSTPLSKISPKVEVTKNSNPADSNPPDADNAVNENPETLESSLMLNQSLLSILLCPVCWEFITRPIHQCKRGHLICLPCMQRLNFCPTCRCCFAHTRNLAMEKVADKLLYPCKNDQFGCDKTLRLVDKAEHEENCLHRIYKCILSACKWSGKHEEIMVHMLSDHNEIVHYGDTVTKNVKMRDDSVSNNWIMSAHGEIFRIDIIINKICDKIFGSVQYVGPKKFSNDYSYTIKAESVHKGVKRSVVYTRTTHNDHTKINSMYTFGDGFMMTKITAAMFGLNSVNGMPITISVSKN